ncbi:MAG: adenylyltransferase/cytidyltransferase family protein [Candidatus Paceibacterota bacterium]
MKKIKTISELGRIKKNGKSIGLITGVFDILHYEHVEFLCFAKKKVDVLIVGIECDSNVKLFKGNKRPIFNFNQRALVVSSLKCVDFVFKIPEIKKGKTTCSEFYKNIIKNISIDVLFASSVKDGSYKQKKKSAKELKIKFIGYNKKSKVSSSEVVLKVLSIK